MNDEVLRNHLVELLRGGSAHSRVEQALRELPSTMFSAEHVGHRNSPWRLLEHIRLAQWDILEFSRDSCHVSPEFPDGYWPGSDTAPNEVAWNASIDAICRDLQEMIDIVINPSTDLYAPIPHGDGQTVLREALLVADHNAYHLGQLMMSRRILEGAERRKS